MKHNIFLILVFFAGVLLGRYATVPLYLSGDTAMMSVLYLLLFCVGLNIGSDTTHHKALLKQPWTVLLLPLGTIIGTLAGVSIACLFLNGLRLSDALAVGSGFGYYSLSSILITQVRGVELGMIALVSNIIRELIAIGLAPWIKRFFGPLAPISVGGATTMDTTLPIIQQCCGNSYVVQSIIHGFIVDLSVPFLVTLFLLY